MGKRTVIINDTTLRDGEQCPGVAFTEQEKLTIAHLLVQAGITELEVGIPAMGPEECNRIRRLRKSLAKTRLMTWCRLNSDDILTSAGLGVDWVDISVPASARMRQYKLKQPWEQTLQQLYELIGLANRYGLAVCIGCEDASYADEDELKQLATIAYEAGAKRMRFADTVGRLDPLSTEKYIRQFRKHWRGQLEMHAHNDLGMATANTLMAIHAGATHINTTVLGLGERAGNAPLEQIIFSLRNHPAYQLNIDTQLLPKLCQVVASAAGITIPQQQPLVGERVFTHESGIHVAGIQQNVSSYQAIDPLLLGRTHQLVLGKHSGRSAIISIYQQLGYLLTEPQVSLLLRLLTEYTEQKKRSPSTNVLQQLYQKCLSVEYLGQH